MKIALDISQVVYEGTGVARYTNYLIEALTNYDKKNDYIFFISTLRGSINRHTRDLLKNQIVRRFYLPPSILDLLWNKLHILPFENLVGPVDLVITSDWTEPAIKSAKKITIVHDLVYLTYPQTLHKTILQTQSRKMQWVKKESDLIIADSVSTKQDLAKLLDIEDRRIKVVYPAVEIKQLTSNDATSVLNKYNLNKPFILAVGKLEPRKNISRLIQSFEKIGNKNINLVVVGPTGWGEQNHNVKNNPNIKFLGHISDNDLYGLYAEALCFVMPSLYEGFGYPLVEAMTLGCPVATSDVSSMKEVVQDSGLLFDPLSIESISNALNKLIENDKLRNELIKKGRKRVDYFCLSRFANEFIEIINSFKKR